MANQILLDDGASYEVLHAFSDQRALIRYDGAVVFVDRISPTSYELSGEPARQNEKAIYRTFVPDETVTTFTKDGAES